MLYLEARCLSLVRAAGSQGVQNGSISCVALALSVPGRDARGARRERARRLARPRGRVGQRRDREPLGDPQDGEADGAVPAGHRLRHLGLLVDAALRQHVRRRQLRLARLRRVADDAARLAGRRRDRAARRGGRARGARARRRARCRRSSTSSASRRSATRRCGSPPTCLDSRDLPDRDRAADVLAGDRVLAEGISGLDVARALERRGFAGRRRRRLRDAAPAGRRRLPADLGDHRRRRHRQSRPSTTATTTRARAPGYRLEGERWERLRSCRYAIDARLLGGGAAGRPGGRASRARREPGRAPDEVVIAVGPAFGERARRDDQRPLARATCSRRSSTGVRERGRRCRASCASGARPTSRSSATTAPCSPARASRSGCSRRGRR